ncbi:39S ribosomal protein L30, mitochondrial [Leptopilina heterotoma]|uniref:39S ribosomal protein L30, mitochondrial n=1 Tax=Leptopilina heterotoma TaxID=63436 RepID=UPI001CA948B8|nr:39S ribosomal protein L30, mitochondrial [Leptopilina heterotoma]
MDKLYKAYKHSYKVTRRGKYLSKGVKKLWQNDVVNYNGVYQYPRKLDHQDPPIKPSKLLMVEQVKSLSGSPYWDKEIMSHLKFDDFYDAKLAIVKNTPQICESLMKVKHLIKITPIDLPEELPKDLLTNKDTYLHESGKLMIFPRVDQKRLDALDGFKKNVKKFDGNTMRKYLRHKWMNPIDSNGSVYNNVNKGD